MTDPLAVRPGENGILRLFALDMAAEQARLLGEPGAVAKMLGVQDQDLDLDPEQINLINIADLSDISLAGYLTQGCAIPEDQVDHAAMAALSGHVLAIRSRAFRGRAATLAPTPRLTLIGAYSETPADWSAKPMQTSTHSRRRSPRAARSQARRIGSAVFAVIMALLVAIVILVAT